MAGAATALRAPQSLIHGRFAGVATADGVPRREQV